MDVFVLSGCTDVFHCRVEFSFMHATYQSDENTVISNRVLIAQRASSAIGEICILIRLVKYYIE